MMITDDHKDAMRELLKLVQSKMGADEGKIPGDVEAPEGEMDDAMGAEDEIAADQNVPKDVQEVEASEDGIDPSMLEDMRKTFGGREDDSMPFGKKGVRMGVTEISAMPMKKPMRR
jgi:hypothetical protein